MNPYGKGAKVLFDRINEFLQDHRQPTIAPRTAGARAVRALIATTLGEYYDDGANAASNANVQISIEEGEKLDSLQKRFDMLREQYQKLNEGSAQQVRRINALEEEVKTAVRCEVGLRERNSSLIAKMSQMEHDMAKVRNMLIESNNKLIVATSGIDELGSVPGSRLSDESTELKHWRLVGENLQEDIDSPAFELALVMSARLLEDAQ